MQSKALFDVPPGAAAKVSIIDSSLRLNGIPVEYLMGPGVDGLDTFPTCPTWCFLVESSTGQKAIFDLGVPPDVSTFSPAVYDKLKSSGWSIEVRQHVADILKD